METGTITPAQRAIVEKFTEGFDAPKGKVIYIMPPGGGKSVVMEALQKHYKGMEIVAVAHDEYRSVTAGELDMVIIDSVSDIEELWEMKTGRVGPTRSVMLDAQSIGRSIARRVISDKINEMLEIDMEKLFPEKPYLAMNDWRNNRGGRKHR